MTDDEKSDWREERRRNLTSRFIYNLNKTDYDRQKKELDAAELQASGKFPRRGRRLPKKEATGNPPTTLL